MSLIAHEIAPEAVMALLDGELGPEEARAVEEHLKGCSECAKLAEELKMTSQGLAEWTVPAMPAGLEAAIRSEAVRVRRSRRSRAGWNWKWWVLGSGVLAAGVCLSVLFPTVQHKSTPNAQMMYFNEPMASAAGAKADRFTGGGLEQLGRGGIIGGNSRAAMAMKAPPSQPGGEVKTQMIARTASLTIEAKQIEAARAALEAMLARHHGYAAQLGVDTPEYGQRSMHGSLRVPAAELDASLAEFKTLGRVESESQSGEEVSQQHEDLEARLKTARDTEERFRSILQQRTGTVADVLQVQEGIARVRSEIEEMEAEQRGLEHRVAYASVEITLTEEFKARLDAPGDSVGTQMGNAFVVGYHHAAGTVLGIVLFAEEYGPALLIWGVILGVPVWLGWRRWRRVRV
jgi:hypothetical protein